VVTGSAQVIKALLGACDIPADPVHLVKNGVELVEDEDDSVRSGVVTRHATEGFVLHYDERVLPDVDLAFDLVVDVPLVVPYLR
jgi:hypothetical protein